MRDRAPFSPHTAEYERLAESMGMDLQAFKMKYLTDPPFHALVVVHLSRERELREALGVLNIPRLREYAEADIAEGERWIRLAPQTFLETVIERLEALLAQPAAGEERERG